MRKTIAIIGDTVDYFPGVMKVLMKQDLRLLLISEDEELNSNLKTSLKQTEAVAEVEFTSCEKEGCWEADIIVITQPDKASSTLLERIKEVATQKIVLVTAKSREKLENFNLQQVLPNSHVVELLWDPSKKGLLTFGKSPEAKAEVQEIFRSAGFEVQN